MTTTTLTGPEALLKVLRDHDGGPMPVKELTAAAAKLTAMKGKTPQATLAAKVYTAAKKGETFEIVERGVVRLRVGATPRPVEELPNGDGPTAAPVEAREAKPDPKPTPKTPEQKRAEKAQRERERRAAKKAAAAA